MKSIKATFQRFKFPSVCIISLNTKLELIAKNKPGNSKFLVKFHGSFVKSFKCLKQPNFPKLVLDNSF